MPVGFKKFGGAATVTPPPEAPVKEVVAEVVKPTPAPAPAPAPKVTQQRAVSVFTGQASSGNALAAFIQQADEKPALDLFPVVLVAGGNNGGQFDAASYQSDDLKQLLPSGRKPIDAVVLGYRAVVQAYPVAYATGAKDKPAWTVAIPSHNGDLMFAATKLCRSYQFTKKANKGRFDFATSGVGHTRPTLEVLAYLPSANMVVIIRSPSHYNSVERSLRELSAHIAADGSLNPFPCRLETVTTSEGEDTANPWKIHHIVFKAVPAKDQTSFKTAFENWVTAAQEDTPTIEAYQKWLEGGDRPIDVSIEEAITKGSRM